LLAIMLSVGSLILVLSAFGVPVAVTYLSSRSDARNGALLGNSLLYGGLLAVVLVPSFWLLQDPIGDLVADGHGGSAWVLAAVLIPLTFLDWSTHNQLLGGLRFGLFNVFNVVGKVVSLVAVIVLLGLVHLGVAGGLIAVGSSSVIVIAGATVVIARKEGLSLDLGVWRKMVNYGRRVQVGSIFEMANARLDVVILQFFRPLSQVGYYVIAQIIAELVMTLAQAFQSSVLPLVSHYEGQQRQVETTIASVRHHGILAAAAVLFNAVFGSLLILFAYGDQFRPALGPMLIILPGIWFLGTGTVIAADLRGRGRPGLSSSLSGLAMFITVVLDLALIPPLGVIGAAIASLVAYCTFGTASLVALARVSGIGLRRLVVPERSDFRAYATALRRLRGRRKPAEAGTPERPA
jgi:O-antigen/teichoic acid export membrane protein